MHSFQGPVGPKGEIGFNGTTGLKGSKVHMYASWIYYYLIEQGEQGPQGISGPIGLNGTEVCHFILIYILCKNINNPRVLLDHQEMLVKREKLDLR